MKLRDYGEYEIHVDDKTGLFSAKQRVVQPLHGGGSFSKDDIVVKDKTSLQAVIDELKKMSAIRRTPAIIKFSNSVYEGEITSLKEVKGYGGRRDFYFRFIYKHDEGRIGREEISPGSSSLVPATPENMGHLKAIRQLEFQISQIQNAIDARIKQMKGTVSLDDVKPEEAT